jgi:hypothetical protein
MISTSLREVTLRGASGRDKPWRGVWSEGRLNGARCGACGAKGLVFRQFDLGQAGWSLIVSITIATTRNMPNALLSEIGGSR